MANAVIPPLSRLNLHSPLSLPSLQLHPNHHLSLFSPHFLSPPSPSASFSLSLSLKPPKIPNIPSTTFKIYTRKTKIMMMESNNNNINSSSNNLNGGALFPVVFFDGEREIDLGTIVITPSMNFKAFQSMLSQKIGISPHQITTYFTPIHHHNHHHHQRRRHPVTNKFNFAAAIAESNSTFFWVVLKRSRRVRRRRPKASSAGPTFAGDDHDDESFSPENFVLLRRNPNSGLYGAGGGAGEVDYVMEYANRLRLLEIEQERYLMSLNLNSNVYSDLSFYSKHGNSYYGGIGMSSEDGASSSGFGSENRVVCDVCLNASMEGETVPFHWCKNDAVTVVHRSPAGPIGPPAKNKLY